MSVVSTGGQISTSDDAFDLDSQGNRYGDRYGNAYQLNIPAQQNVTDGNVQSLALFDGGTAQLTMKYDAWGRLCQVSSTGGSSFANYRQCVFVYDALGRHVETREYTIGADTSTATPMSVEEDYYDGSSLIEQRSGQTLTSQYVWSPDNRLILRDRDADGNPATGNFGKSGSGLDQRVYVLSDGQGNVVALPQAQVRPHPRWRAGAQLPLPRPARLLRPRRQPPGPVRPTNAARRDAVTMKRLCADVRERQIAAARASTPPTASVAIGVHRWR